MVLCRFHCNQFCYDNFCDLWKLYEPCATTKGLFCFPPITESWIWKGFKDCPPISLVYRLFCGVPGRLPLMV